jgi:hypothetical protein
MTTTTTPTGTRRTNERVELARYRVSAGARVIYGQRVLGVVRLSAEVCAAPMIGQARPASADRAHPGRGSCSPRPTPDPASQAGT